MKLKFIKLKHWVPMFNPDHKFEVFLCDDKGKYIGEVTATGKTKQEARDEMLRLMNIDLSWEIRSKTRMLQEASKLEVLK